MTKIMINESKEVCQRPERAFFISTAICSFADGKKHQFSVNALNGLSSFLPCYSKEYKNHANSVCQRPERAFFISTLVQGIDALDNGAMCQRPERAFFISTELEQLLISKHKSCVNALNGLSSFLPIYNIIYYVSNFVCQRPERAFFISTGY